MGWWLLGDKSFMVGYIYMRLNFHMELYMKFLSSVLLVLMLAGCATQAKYEKIVNSWMGHSEAELIRSWGPPNSVYESAGRKYLTYSMSSQAFIPGKNPDYKTTCICSSCTSRAVGGYSGQAINWHCTTTFELEAERIVYWRFKGNNCKSK